VTQLETFQSAQGLDAEKTRFSLISQGFGDFGELVSACQKEDGTEE